MADIFISYARADRDRIEKLAAALESQGYSVWWDRDLSSGDEFSKEIEAELNAAKAVIVAWSKNGVESPWVRDEASLARQQKKLFPIRLDSENAPLGFQQFHTIDFSHWHGGNDVAFAALLDSLNKKVRGAVTTASANPAASIARPAWLVPAIAVAAIVVVIAAVFSLRPDREDALSPAAEVAENQNIDAVVKDGDQITLGVIPFVNMSSDPEQEHFADGLSEELLNWLANVEGLKVPGRTASFQFKDEVGEFAEIGRRLGVKYLLEGSVRRSGDQLRITAQLIEAESGYHLWSEAYDRQSDDVFEIQDDVAQRVVTALLGELPPSAAQNPVALSGVDPKAHELYLEGRSLWTERDYYAAISKFQSAIEIDPGHWLAQSYFAIVGSGLIFNGHSVADYGDNFPDAVRAAIRAAEALKPEAADVLFARGWVTEMLTSNNASAPGQLDPASSEYYRRAIRANPRHAEALHALTRAVTSDDERVEFFRRVLEIEPGHLSATMNYFDELYSRGEIEKAKSLLRQFQDLTQRRDIFPVGDSMKMVGDWRSYYEMAAASLVSNAESSPVEKRRIAMVLADLGELDASAQLFRNAAIQLTDSSTKPWVDSRADLLMRDFDAVDRKMRAFANAENTPRWMPTVVGKSLLYNGNEQEVFDLLSEFRPDLFEGDQLNLIAGDFDSVLDFTAHTAALALDRLGRNEEADRLWLALLPVLDEPRFSGWRRHIGRAIVFAQTDDPDRAFAELDLAYDAGFRFLYSYYCQGCLELDFFVDNTYFGPIFYDPRFQAFVEKVEKENAGFFSELDQIYDLGDAIKALQTQAISDDE